MAWEDWRKNRVGDAEIECDGTTYFCMLIAQEHEPGLRYFARFFEDDENGKYICVASAVPAQYLEEVVKHEIRAHQFEQLGTHGDRYRVFACWFEAPMLRADQLVEYAAFRAAYFESLYLFEQKRGASDESLKPILMASCFWRQFQARG